MRFRIHHRTHYLYAGPARESFMEARLTPAHGAGQSLQHRRLDTTPACQVHAYTDYFGNQVETFSIVHRHKELVLDSHAEVETCPEPPPDAALAVNVSEARQLFRGESLKLHEFLAPSSVIPRDAAFNRLARRFFRPGDELGPALLRLNTWIKAELRYAPGVTTIDTPVITVLRHKSGVCQDFAQLMIAILRAGGLPARYVAGYIETETQRRASAHRATPPLVGASESHAWVEAYLPGGYWWPLDPTNDCLAGERHVKVAVGRDYRDSTPTRGVFKGTHTRRLSAAVVMQRL
jgi:transglutaminase-like putative cysteine protease